MEERERAREREGETGWKRERGRERERERNVFFGNSASWITNIGPLQGAKYKIQVNSNYPCKLRNLHANATHSNRAPVRNTREIQYTIKLKLQIII